MLKQSVYDITSKNDKSLFCLYLNLSELNAYIVLKHISDKLDLTAPNGSKLENAKLLELLSKPKKELAKAEKAYEMINKHFPWLNTMLYSPEKNVEENLEGAMLHASEILSKMLKSLHILRNHFAHFQPNDQALDKWIEEEWLDILSSLNCCFDAAVRNVKEEKLKGHLDSTIEIHINHLRRRKKGTGKTTIPNPSFGYDFIVSKDVHVPNGNAIVFFTSLFLGKKDAVLFLNKTPGLKRTDSIWAKATLYVFFGVWGKGPQAGGFIDRR